MQVKGPKTQAGYRSVVIGPLTIAELKRLRVEQVRQRLALRGQYYTSEDLVICKPDGRPYRPDSTSTQFRTFVDRHGLPNTVHVHTLRHSAASFLAAAGVPASDIAAQLGHKDGGAWRSRSTSTPWPRALPAPAPTSTTSSGVRREPAPDPAASVLVQGRSAA
jgi:integrase